MILLFCKAARAVLAVRPPVAVGRLTSFAVATVVLASQSMAPAYASSPSPYEMTFKALSDTAVRVEMDVHSQQLGTIRRGTRGIRLLWCEPAISIEAWQNVSPQNQLVLLSGRWCEIEADGMIGNVDAGTLAPG